MCATCTVSATPVIDRLGNLHTIAELSAAFDAVKSAEHWKAPIDAQIRGEEVVITLAAIEYYTATQGKLGSFNPSTCTFRVTAPGYWAGPAN